MKRTPLIHSELSGLIAAMGHGDLLVIGDAGLPVPPGVRCIDLAVTRNVPRFLDVLDAVLAEMVVERSAWASEAGAPLQQAFQARDLGTPATLAHEAFKALTRDARAVVRTGEFTPHANVALWSGVAF
ncbi:D-ribose pyranase [Paracoccus sp. YIM 132242]|uniref:D-ribose pyranase n=1 Tax=Paracoccus lichenicola TaxID=2665644 RepID=A0A6L6HLZ4_9RHOB|nr:D-ribose pyranase [Paracoccus lichenicola]MTD99192.1 D-ribose pyranase [Paracoccus lichenicola]